MHPMGESSQHVGVESIQTDTWNENVMMCHVHNVVCIVIVIVVIVVIVVIAVIIVIVVIVVMLVSIVVTDTPRGVSTWKQKCHVEPLRPSTAVSLKMAHL